MKHVANIRDNYQLFQIILGLFSTQMKNILEQISIIADNENISIGTLERKIGASKGVLSRAIANKTDIQAKWLQKIVENYPNYDAKWILTGDGSMLRDEKKQEVNAPEVHIVDNSSMGFIMDRYEALAVENALLKKEVEQLKQSRGNDINKPAYSFNPDPVVNIAAEPPPKYTR